MTKPASFEMSADTRLIRQSLAKAAPGDIVTYKQLSDEIRKDVDGSFSALHSARASLLRHDNMVFDVVRGVGLQRLKDTEIVAASASDIKSIRHKARKAARKITSVSDFNGLPPQDQLRHTAALSVFTAIADMSSEKGVKKVEAAAQGRSGELPIAQTLSAFAS